MMINELPRPEVILTHESDLDGLVAGVLLQRLAQKLFATTVPLEAYHYHQWRQREMREASAWVTDLAFDRRIDRPNWTIIDHHVTDSTPVRAKLIHDTSKSAGLLCYELCREAGLGSHELDRLVRLNNVADLFLEDEPDFVLACDYANLVKIYQFSNLHALIGGEIEKLLDHPLLEVMEVKRRIEDPLGLAWSRENILEIAPLVGFVNTVVGNNNIIVHQLLEQRISQYPVLMTLFRRASGVTIVSIRSRNGEALEIAEKLHGGGHGNAAAATLPRSIKNTTEAITYLRQVLNPKHAEPLGSLEDLFSEMDKPR